MKRVLALLLMGSMFATGAAVVTVRAWQDLPNDRYTRREAENIGARLFKAIVGRDGGKDGPAEAATQIMLGKLQAQVEAMFESSEFRQKASGMNASQLLDQFYQGLLDRKADDAGVRTYLRDVEGRRYASVVMKIINDSEFERRILGRPAERQRPNNDRGGGYGGGSYGGGRYSEAELMRSAEACQMAVLEEMRADLGGPILVRFQSMDRTSSLWGEDTIRGTAVEVFDRSQRLSYRCEMERGRFRPTRVSYDFDRRFDRRDYRNIDDYDYPLASVRACQSDIRSRLARDRRRDITFESAGVSEWDRNLDRVYGRGRERGSSYRFEYRCDIERGRVTGSDVQSVR